MVGWGWRGGETAALDWLEPTKEPPMIQRGGGRGGEGGGAAAAALLVKQQTPVGDKAPLRRIPSAGGSAPRGKRPRRQSNAIAERSLDSSWTRDAGRPLRLLWGRSRGKTGGRVLAGKAMPYSNARWDQSQAESTAPAYAQPMLEASDRPVQSPGPSVSRAGAERVRGGKDTVVAPG